jgi:hypothetical protein
VRLIRLDEGERVTGIERIESLVDDAAAGQEADNTAPPGPADTDSSTDGTSETPSS